jgi:energy-coupling factor transport system ATP-binding protein
MSHPIELKLLELPDGRKIDGLRLLEGESLGIIGPIDSGKTATLIALMGHSIRGTKFNRTTELNLSQIGFVPTDPELLFSGMKSDLKGEIDLSAQFLGRSTEDTQDIIRQFEIENLLSRDPFTLSGGEMIRACLAIVAMKRPSVWLLDQVFDSMHPESVSKTRLWIRNRLNHGDCFVETYSSAPSCVRQLDNCLFFDAGGNCVAGKYEDVQNQVRNKLLISECDRVSLRFESDLKIEIEDRRNTTSITNPLKELVCKPTSSSMVPKKFSDAVIELDDFRFSYSNGGFLLGPIKSKFFRGEIIGVAGPNGSGKTTFIKCIANLLHPYSGTLVIGSERPTKRKWKWARKAFYCFQNPDDQLYMPTVSDEVLRTRKALGRNLDLNFEEFCKDLGLGKHMGSEPFHLARPLRRLVSLACGFLSGSPVILLDEPTAGMDIESKSAIGDAIRRLAGQGVTVVMVTHDYAFMAENVSRVLAFSNGKIVSDTPENPWPLADQPLLVEIASCLGIKETKYSRIIQCMQN